MVGHGTKIGRVRAGREGCEGLRIDRFFEPVLGHGAAWKALIGEEFGDGSMSAIGFGMSVERLADAKCDRAKLDMAGRFLAKARRGKSTAREE